MSAITQEMSALAGGWIVTPSWIAVPADAQAHQLLPANPLRWGLHVANAQNSGLGGASILLVPGGTAQALGGIPLPAAGYLHWNYRVDPGFVGAAWSAFNGGGAPTTLFVVEILVQQ